MIDVTIREEWVIDETTTPPTQRLEVVVTGASADDVLAKVVVTGDVQVGSAALAAALEEADRG